MCQKCSNFIKNCVICDKEYFGSQDFSHSCDKQIEISLLESPKKIKLLTANENKSDNETPLKDMKYNKFVSGLMKIVPTNLFQSLKK